eukprot:gene12266-49803_t
MVKKGGKTKEKTEAGTPQAQPQGEAPPPVPALESA